MIFVHQFRAFRNSDPPLVAAIWCSQRPQRGLAQPMSAAQLEQAVFSKLHFDRHGLIVATHGDLPCGFAHAGFGPTADETGVSTEVGVVSMLMVHSAVEQRGAGVPFPLLNVIQGLIIVFVIASGYLTRKLSETVIGGRA